MVLSTLGRVLSTVLPAPDVAFRLSRDEFALLVGGQTERLKTLITRLSDGLRAADWPLDSGLVCLSRWSGTPEARGDLVEWLSLADARMYEVKRRRGAGQQVNGGLDFGNMIWVEYSVNR